MKRLYIGLGANIGNRKRNIHRATELLEKQLGAPVFLSPLYETEPVDFVSTNKFMNAAAVIEINDTFSPNNLLCITQQIEREIGRSQKSINGIHTDRIIDIDLLAYDNIIYQSETLTLPHPQLPNRRFVLEPLTDIAPNFIIKPWNVSVKQLFDRLLDKSELIIERWTTTITPLETEEVNLLLAQLTNNFTRLEKNTLQQIIDNNIVLTLRHKTKQRIVGTATACLSLMPTGRKAWIEDVVIDQTLRGKGYGKLLIEKLVALTFQEKNLRKISLTSRPERIAANKLYASCGFELRNTNVYQITAEQFNNIKQSTEITIDN